MKLYITSMIEIKLENIFFLSHEGENAPSYNLLEQPS